MTPAILARVKGCCDILTGEVCDCAAVALAPLLRQAEPDLHVDEGELRDLLAAIAAGDIIRSASGLPRWRAHHGRPVAQLMRALVRERVAELGDGDTYRIVTEVPGA